MYLYRVPIDAIRNICFSIHINNIQFEELELLPVNDIQYFDN